MSDADIPLPDEGEAPVEDVLILTFDPPVKLRQATYGVMTLTEPTGRMVRQAEALLRPGVNVESLRRYQILLISLVSGWPIDAVEMLPIRKVDEAGRFLERYTSLGQLIGRM